MSSRDPRDQWHPLTFRERLQVTAVVHELWYLLAKAVRMRDRMRCPRCRAVGTWKMHGAWLERYFADDIAVRRWLCKWCGHYIGPNGRTAAYPSRVRGVWALPGTDEVRDPTPAEVVSEHMGKTWPWFG